MKLYETHCHVKEFSLDGKRTLDELLTEADAKHFSAVCLTDHYDKDGINGVLERYASAYGEKPAEGEWIFDVEEYFAKLLPIKHDRAQKPEKTQLLIGAELGYTDYLVPVYEKLIADWPFDQIIASIHFIDDIDIYFSQAFYEQGKKNAYLRWMQTLIEMAESPLDYDVLGHFDYVIRYAKYDNLDLYYDDYPDEFDALLKALIARDRALEINTRYRYKKINEGLPDPGFVDKRIIQRFVDLGGELISISSDSHENGTLGHLFDDCAKELYALGVKRSYYFKNRRPHYINFD